MAVIREVKEGLQHQGLDEKVAYKITTTPWASSPTSITVKVFDITTTGTRTDVTATVMPAGSASAVGDVITLPLLQALTVDHYYRVEVAFASGGNTFEVFFVVKAEY